MPKIAQKDLPKLAVKGSTIAEIARQLKDAKAKAKKFEKQMDQQKSLVHRIETEALPPLMESLEGDGVNIAGVGYVELGIELYPYFKKEDQDTFYAWLRDNDQGGIIKETIHPKTLQAWTGEMIDDPEKAGTLPEELVVTKIPTAKLKAEKKSSKRK